jgi:drug/metabolite transporter (DMT)-like permease
MSAAGTSPHPRGRTRLWAAASLVAGIFVFSWQDVILKWMSGSYALTEMVAMRGAGAIVLLLVTIIIREGVGKVISPRAGMLALRGAVLFIAYGTYYMAFPAMKLAEVVTLFFMAPIFITALAYPLLSERAHFSHWFAVLAGFAGVIVTYWPSLDPFEAGGIAARRFDWALLLPVASTLTYAVAQLMARKLKSDSAAVQGLYQNLMYLMGAVALALIFTLGHWTLSDLHPSVAFLVRDWSYGNPTDLALLAACAPISALGTVLLSQAYRMAEANFVASFEYSGIIWGASWGFFFWGEVPDIYMYAGAALIVGAGLYMLFVGRKEEA